MKIFKKYWISAVAFVLTLIVGAYYVIGGFFMKKETTLSANVRTVSLVENEVDYQSVLNEFEDGELTKAGTLTTFTGGQMLDASVFEEFDNVSESDLETLSDCKVSYKFTYDSESNIVTIFAELINETGEMELDEISGVGFINDAGEIDAVMNVDGEGILLSEMREAGLIENCGWFSRAIKKIAKKVVKTVAIVAATAVVATIAVTSPAVVAIGLGIVATVNVVNEAVTQTMAYKNYQHNKMLVQPNGVVNGQSYYSNWRFGAQTFDYNGCGVIATYNVMVLLGRNPSLAQVTYDIESGHGALAWGYLGTDPLHPYKYFQDNGIKVEQYLTYNNFNKSFVNMQMSQYAMICFWNNKNDIRDGAHFVAVQKISENKFAVYNYISNRQTIFYKTSLADIIGQGRFMSGLIIN